MQAMNTTFMFKTHLRIVNVNESTQPATSCNSKTFFMLISDCDISTQQKFVYVTRTSIEEGIFHYVIKLEWPSGEAIASDKYDIYEFVSTPAPNFLKHLRLPKSLFPVVGELGCGEGEKEQP